MTSQHKQTNITAFLQRVIDSQGHPVDNQGEINGPQLAVPNDLTQFQAAKVSSTPHILETGIKAIDLFAPLQHGGITILDGPYGVGKLVVGEEIIQHMIQKWNARIVAVTMSETGYTSSPIREMIHEGQFQEQTVAIFEPLSDEAELCQRMLRTGIYIASQLQTENNETLLLIDPDVINGAHVLDNEDLHAAIEAQGITTLIVNDGDIPMTSIPAYSGYLVFNRTLAKAGHWPAIDRLHSHASTQIITIQSEQHKRIATHVQDILQQGEALQAISAPTHEEQAILARARRLNLFFTQPFLVAEPYSGIPGEHVPLEETLQNCQALLSGSYDTLPEQAFLMVGTLEQAIEKSKQLK